MKFSIIIPTWNEGRHIARSLRRLREISDQENMEIVLVDGGSTDDTAAEAKRWADKLLAVAKPNRGAQLHAGAKAATGDFFFFLHADTQPPGDWQEILERFWLSAHAVEPAASVFTVDYGSNWNYRLVAWGQNARVGLRQIAYGDAGFCVPRETYEAVGGFPELPLMEDIEFSKRLRARGPIVRLPGRIHPAARRLHRYGPLTNAVWNSWIRLRFSLGADPGQLWDRYYAKKTSEAATLSDGEVALKAAVRRSRGEK